MPTLPDIPSLSFFGLSRWLGRAAFLAVMAAGLFLRLLRLESIGELLPGLAWLAGGIVLFGIARRFAGLDGSLCSLAIFLITPYTITPSGR